MKKIFIAAVVLSGVIIWLRSGGAEVVYPERAAEKPAGEASVLWPVTEEQRDRAGEGAGVAVSADGDVYYLHRATGGFGGEEVIDQPVVVKLDPQTGEVKDEWGEGMFVSPHGLTVDHRDHVWITDIALNKVFHFDEKGVLIRTYGDSYYPGLEWQYRIRNVAPSFPVIATETTFARPTDVTVFPDGSFAVSDGYRNARIVKMTEEGQVEWEVDQLGNEEGAFYLPHGISHDREGKIYVADRSNARIQIFNPDGSFYAQWSGDEIGRPFGVEVGRDGLIYVVDGGDNLYENGEENKSQVVVLNSDGQVINRFGEWGDAEGELKIPHDIALGPDGVMYVAELENKRIQRFEP